MIWLDHMGAQVSGYSLKPNTSPSLFDSANLAKSQTEFGDVRDASALEKELTRTQPDIVMHFAAQPLVRYSYENPIETYATNVMGTVHLLNAIRVAPSVKAVVIVTTDKCYENREWAWGYREDDHLGGFDPYSSSKACAEIVTSAMRRSFFTDKKIAIATARAGNVIGGGDWAEDRLIPDMIRAIQTKSILKIRNPGATRPWQHVLEPLGAYLKLAEALFDKGSEFAESWNFGPADKDAKSVGEIVELMSLAWKIQKSSTELKYEFEGNHIKKLHEAHFLKLDCSKAQTRLGWTPRWDAGTAIQKTAEWYKAYYENPKMALQLSLKQIEDYSRSGEATS